MWIAGHRPGELQVSTEAPWALTLLMVTVKALLAGGDNDTHGENDLDPYEASQGLYGPPVP